MKRLAKEKTGREVLGSRLFAGELSLTRYLQALPGDAETYLRETRKEIPAIEGDELRRTLHANFGLHALEVHDLISIRIEVIQRDYYNEYNVVQLRYLHEAVVPYSGSRVFWKALPHAKFEFGFRGRSD